MVKREHRTECKTRAQKQNMENTSFSLRDVLNVMSSAFLNCSFMDIKFAKMCPKRSNLKNKYYIRTLCMNNEILIVYSNVVQYN